MKEIEDKGHNMKEIEDKGHNMISEQRQQELLRRRENYKQRETSGNNY
jgi:hypothetical protein